MLKSGEKFMKNVPLVSVVLAAAMVLSACGVRTDGADGDAQPFFNSNGELVNGPSSGVSLGAANPDDALTLRVVSDVNSLVTGGTDVATISVLVTDIKNNAVADQEIAFSSSGGVLQNIVSMTNANGEASATLKLPLNFQNQDIFVAASAENGAFESVVKITTVGSLLQVTGPKNLIVGDTADISLLLLAGNGEPISNEQVLVTSQAGNSITLTEQLTNSDGRLDFTVSSANGNDTILISALNGTVSATQSFEVVAELLSFTNFEEGSEFSVGNANLVRVNWSNQQQPLAGRSLSFTTTAGLIASPSTVVTDASGNAFVNISSDSAGPAKIAVEATQGGSPRIDIDVEFVATLPQSVTLDASASIVNINETSTITALVKDALGNPVKNSEVFFVGEDLNGGQLNPASAVTNSAGLASVTFTAGESPTTLNEIEVKANVKGTAINDAINLTVFKRALNITLGSANLISIKPLGTQYSMPVIVQVADGSGTPLEGATVKVSVRPLSYGKGGMELVNENNQNIEEVLASGGTFEADQWAIAKTSIACPAEDLNGNRYLDTLGVLSEDFNNNGSLDPQDPAALAAVEGNFATLSGGSLKTDANGSGFFELLYPASNSLWSYVEITARAEALGVEATDTFRTVLAMPAAEVNATKQLPANYASPYGSFDVDTEVVMEVISNGESMSVYKGCTTTL